MKQTLLHSRARIAALLLIALASAGHGQVIVGSGSSSSYFVIEAADFGAPQIYEYRYDYSPASPPDTYSILSAIDAAISELNVTFINYGSTESPSYFIDEISWNGVSLGFDGDNYWVQWVAGGRTSSTDFDTMETTYFDAPDGTWTFGNGISAPYRLDEPGSWDGLIFNDGSTPPSVSPVPEPAVLALFAAGAVAIVFRARRRHA